MNQRTVYLGMYQNKDIIRVFDLIFKNNLYLSNAACTILKQR